MNLLGPPPAVAAEFAVTDFLMERSQEGQRLIAIGGRLDAVQTTDPARPEAGQAVDWV